MRDESLNKIYLNKNTTTHTQTNTHIHLSTFVCVCVAFANVKIITENIVGIRSWTSCQTVGPGESSLVSTETHTHTCTWEAMSVCVQLGEFYTCGNVDGNHHRVAGRGAKH